jgi:hypothetical protein
MPQCTPNQWNNKKKSKVLIPATKGMHPEKYYVL